MALCSPESEREKKSSQRNGGDRRTPETTVETIFKRSSRVRVSGRRTFDLFLLLATAVTCNYAQFGFSRPFRACAPLETRERARPLSPEFESSSHCVYFLRKQSEGILPRCFHDCLAFSLFRVRQILLS